MPDKLPEGLKKQAKEKCAAFKHLEVPDPGTVYRPGDGRVFVMVVDKPTGTKFWLEVTDEQ